MAMRLFCCQVPTIEPPNFAISQDGEPSFVAFFLQQLFVPATSLLILVIVPSIPDEFVKSWVGWQLMEIVRCLFVAAMAGLLLGSVVQRLFPIARSSGGRWIAVIPVISLIWALLSDTLTFSLSEALTDLLFPRPDGEGWWAFFLLTCPTVSTIAYSAVMAWPLFAQKGSGPLIVAPVQEIDRLYQP